MAKSDKFDMVAFGSRLKAARIQAGYQEKKEFADKIHINDSTYNPYEKGKALPSYDSLYEIAKALKVSPDYLLGFKQELSLADIASALMALSFDRNVKMRRKTIIDEVDKQEKQIIRITILGGDLRQIMSDFIEFSHDRKPPEKQLQYFKNRLNEISREPAWSSKDEYSWNEFMNKMLRYRGEATNLTEPELKKFFYGGIDDGEPQTEDEQEWCQIL